MNDVNDAIEGLDTLERSFAEIAGAAAPAEVFRAFLDGTRAAAPRAALLLARAGAFKGWSCVGYPPGPAARFRTLSLAPGNPWLESILSEPGGFASVAGAGPLGDFGQSDAVEAAALVVRIGERPVALAVVERGPDEGPWQPAALRMLGHAARLRLELDLAWRRLRVGPKPVASETGGTRSEEPAVTEPPPEPRRPAPPPEPAAALEPIDPAPAADPAREGARRFARLVATEIRLYNEENVLLGRKHRDLSTRLADPIEQGRATFSRRFPDLKDEGIRILEEAYLQVLAGGDASLLPHR